MGVRSTMGACRYSASLTGIEPTFLPVGPAELLDGGVEWAPPIEASEMGGAVPFSVMRSLAPLKRALAPFGVSTPVAGRAFERFTPPDSGEVHVTVATRRILPSTSWNLAFRHD
jgi:hypothetical protein